MTTSVMLQREPRNKIQIHNRRRSSGDAPWTEIDLDCEETLPASFKGCDEIADDQSFLNTFHDARHQFHPNTGAPSWVRQNTAVMPGTPMITGDKSWFYTLVSKTHTTAFGANSYLLGASIFGFLGCGLIPDAHAQIPEHPVSMHYYAISGTPASTHEDHESDHNTLSKARDIYLKSAEDIFERVVFKGVHSVKDGVFQITLAVKPFPTTSTEWLKWADALLDKVEENNPQIVGYFSLKLEAIDNET